jgi:hypothetical protein
MLRQLSLSFPCLPQLQRDKPKCQLFEPVLLLKLTLRHLLSPILLVVVVLIVRYFLLPPRTLMIHLLNRLMFLVDLIVLVSPCLSILLNSAMQNVMSSDSFSILRPHQHNPS